MAYYYQGTLRNMAYRLRKFRTYLDEYLEDYFAFSGTQELLTGMVANSQLYRRGIEGFGTKIMSYAPYAPRTIANKKRKGQPYTRVTLKDTGAFYEGFKVIANSEGFYITSTDEKTDKLVEKYGQSIFRLTAENFSRLIRSHLRKDLSSFIRIKYGLKIK